jgi:ankyrin repeat protein
MARIISSKDENMPGREAVDQSERNRQLLDAAREADVETVKRLLTGTATADINARTPDKMTALYRTVLWDKRGCEEVVDVLLKHGADYTIRDADEETPLWRAVAEGTAENVRRLLEKDLNVDAVNIGGIPMLYRAAKTGNKEVLNMLLEKKPNLEAKGADGETPLWRAVEGGDEEIVRCLLNVGADVNAKDSRSRSILHRVVNSNRTDIMVMLVALAKMELVIDPRDDDVATPLWHAVADEKDSFRDYLLAHGADDKINDKRDVSILHLAAEKGNHELVRDLIERKAEINAYDAEGKSSLSRAVASGSKDCVELLLKAGAEIEHMDSAGVTIFHEAVKSNNMEIIKLLKDARMAAAGVAELVVDGPVGMEAFRTIIDSKAENGETPLLRAVINENQEIVEFLLCNGARLNGFDREGDSELSNAAFSGNLGIVRLLLQNNPNIESKSLEGMTPFLWAAFSGSVEVGRLLFEEGAAISTITNDGETALFFATFFGHISFMELLFKLSINAENSKQQIPSPSGATGNENPPSPHSKLGIELKDLRLRGRTPLLLAAANGSKEAVALLLENGANDEVKDDLGCTALQLATQSKSHESVTALLSTASSVIVNAKNKDGDTALHLAAGANLDKIVQALLDYRPPKPPSKAPKGQTLDDHAIKSKVATSRREKNNTGELAVSLKEKNNNGETAFSLAVQQEADAIVQILIRHDADIEYFEESDETDQAQRVPWPVVVESTEVVFAAKDLLVKRESSWGEDELKILYWAARNGLEKLVQSVLSRNSSSKGEALYWAAVGGKKAVVDSLLGIKDGDEFQKLFKADDGALPRALQAAARLGYYEIVKQLSDGFTRLDPEMITADHVGPKAVQAAAKNDHQNVVQQLIKTLMLCKPEVFRLGDAHDDTKAWSPLHWAIHYNSEESEVIVQNLLMSGADAAVVLEVAKSLKNELRPTILEMLKTPLRLPRKPLELLEPKAQPSLVQACCKPFDINIIDIYSWEGRSCTIERIGDVHEIIYEGDNGPSRAMERARKAWKLDSIMLRDQYRWIHLPANNVSGYQSKRF